MPLRSRLLLLAWAALAQAGCTCCRRHTAPPACPPPCGYPPYGGTAVASSPGLAGPDTAGYRIAPRPEYLPPASSSGIEPTRLGDP